MAVDPKTIDPAAMYRVTLGQRAELLGRRLVPGRRYEMRGDSVLALGEAVSDAVAC